MSTPPLGWQLREGLLALRYPERAALWDWQTGTEQPLSTSAFSALAAWVCRGPEPTPGPGAGPEHDPLVPAGVLRPVWTADGWVDALLARRLEQLADLPPDAPTAAAAVYRAIRDGHAARKVIHFDHYQMPAQPATACRRVHLLAEAAGPQPVLLLGDDDLLSLGLAALGIPTHTVDIDGHLLRFIRQLAPQTQTHHSDLTTGLLGALQEKFAVVFGDPMSTYPGVQAFVASALSALAPGGILFLCGHPRLRIIFEHLQSTYRLRLLACHRDFNAYYSPRTVSPLDDRKDLYVLTRA